LRARQAANTWDLSKDRLRTKTLLRVSAKSRQEESRLPHGFAAPPSQTELNSENAKRTRVKRKRAPQQPYRALIDALPHMIGVLDAAG
jgi:hypothetical protein